MSSLLTPFYSCICEVTGFPSNISWRHERNDQALMSSGPLPSCSYLFSKSVLQTTWSFNGVFFSHFFFCLYNPSKICPKKWILSTGNVTSSVVSQTFESRMWQRDSAVVLPWRFLQPLCVFWGWRKSSFSFFSSYCTTAMQILYECLRHIHTND